MNTQQLQPIIEQLTVPGRGILAADESSPTITKRFAEHHIESTEETRRAYREMLFATPGISEFIAGVILYEETLGQKSQDGRLFPQFLRDNNILPGIKVDKGLIDLTNAPNDKITVGLDGLAERLASYRDQGAAFTKWRAVYAISDNTPSCLAINENADLLARYAAIVQNQGLVPIVEPEVLIDGAHTIERCEEVSERVLHALFHALHNHRVSLEHMILKPSMVISGKACPQQANTEQVATATVRVLKRTVPSAVPTINFLSGGQTEQQATEHLQLMNQLLASSGRPWNLNFSYARALQSPALAAWRGQANQVDVAQKIFFKRAKLNSLASLGRYEVKLEQN